MIVNIILFVSILARQFYCADTEITSTNSSLTNQTVLIRENTQNKELLSEIFSDLDKKMALKCEYSANPKLAEICPDFDEKLVQINARNQSFSSEIRSLLQSLTPRSVYNLIVNASVVTNLKRHCKVGEWCLDDSNTSIKELIQQILHKHSHVFCLYAECAHSIQEYVSNCVSSQLERSVLNIAPILCDISQQESKINDYCITPSLQLVHTAIAAYELTNKGSQKNFCESSIREERVCRKECKKIAYELNKLSYCCSNSSLTRNFETFEWFFNFRDQVDMSCDLPITSLCLSEGQYFIGISSNIVVVAVVLTAIFMSCIFLVVYMCCCRKTLVVKQPFLNTYQYAQLNGEVEEEMSMSHADELMYEKHRAAKHDFLLDFENEEEAKLSTFVNQ